MREKRLRDPFGNFCFKKSEKWCMIKSIYVYVT